MLVNLLDFIPLMLFAAVCGVLMLGYPVALSLAGTALIFAGIGYLLLELGVPIPFEIGYMGAMPSRLYGIMTNQTLLAVPLFVLMGVLLEKSRVAATLLDTMALAFGTLRGGLGIAVILVGMLLAIAWLKPSMAPPADREELMQDLGHTGSLWPLLLKSLVPPILLIVIVLGSILGGFATPTEASAVGAFGAFLLALANRRLSLQTSFLTPPFGFALFYLRGVTPASVPTSAIYRGVVPFIGLQLGMLLALALFPGLATWLPSLL